MKTCARCKVNKPFSEFYPSRRAASGYASYCRPCSRASRNEWVEANRERVRLTARKCYQRNPELYRNKAKRRHHKFRKSQTAQVYFIQGEQTGLIKIGRTQTSVVERLAALQTGSPDKLRVLLVLPDQDEFLLHLRFAAHRAHGEWFHPAQPILDFVNGQNSLSQKS